MDINISRALLFILCVGAGVFFAWDHNLVAWIFPPAYYLGCRFYTG